MSFPMTALLGLIAGGTILLGLPIARIKRPALTMRLLLSSLAVGVLIFLEWDVLSAAWEPIDAAIGHPAKTGALIGYSVLFVGGLAVGLLGITFFERRLASRSTAGDLPPKRLALIIAIGIGLHNFAEGLAIGQSAGSGAISLAVVLVVGFALHNATEGFGIAAPLTGQAERPSWLLLFGLAAIGGGPTLIGTLVGWQFSSTILSVLFLTLAAGSILFVIIQLLGVLARARRMDLVAIGVLVGLIAGFATDAVVTAGGA